MLGWDQSQQLHSWCQSGALEYTFLHGKLKYFLMYCPLFFSGLDSSGEWSDNWEYYHTISYFSFSMSGFGWDSIKWHYDRQAVYGNYIWYFIFKGSGFSYQKYTAQSIRVFSCLDHKYSWIFFVNSRLQLWITFKSKSFLILGEYECRKLTKKGWQYASYKYLVSTNKFTRMIL